MSIDYAERARALIGMPFRLQGRGADGVDCVGVAVETFGVPVESVRRDYRIRGDHLAEMQQVLGPYFRRVPATEVRAGDLLLMRISTDQLHLGIRTAGGFVHAHARLKRVVETPGTPEWPIVCSYRRRR